MQTCYSVHLKTCMENRKFEMFPHVEERQELKMKGGRILQTHVKELFCTCRLPEDDQVYFQCTNLQVVVSSSLSGTRALV